MAEAIGWLRRVGFVLLLVIGVPYVGCGLVWRDVEVALPDDAGVLTFSYRPGPYLLSDGLYRIHLRRADGQVVRGDIPANLSGQTVVLLHWLPIAEGDGPYLMMEDDDRWTWLDVGRSCLWTTDSDQSGLANPCGRDGPPQSRAWRFFGHIDDQREYPALRYVPGSEPPIDLPLLQHIGRVGQRGSPEDTIPDFPDPWRAQSEAFSLGAEGFRTEPPA